MTKGPITLEYLIDNWKSRSLEEQLEYFSYEVVENLSSAKRAIYFNKMSKEEQENPLFTRSISEYDKDLEFALTQLAISAEKVKILSEGLGARKNLTFLY